MSKMLASSASSAADYNECQKEHPEDIFKLYLNIIEGLGISQLILPGNTISCPNQSV